MTIYATVYKADKSYQLDTDSLNVLVYNDKQPQKRWMYMNLHSDSVDSDMDSNSRLIDKNKPAYILQFSFNYKLNGFTACFLYAFLRTIKII